MRAVSLVAACVVHVLGLPVGILWVRGKGTWSQQGWRQSVRAGVAAEGALPGERGRRGRWWRRRRAVAFQKRLRGMGPNASPLQATRGPGFLPRPRTGTRSAAGPAGQTAVFARLPGRSGCSAGRPAFSSSSSRAGAGLTAVSWGISAPSLLPTRPSRSVCAEG